MVAGKHLTISFIELYAYNPHDLVEDSADMLSNEETKSFRLFA